MGIAITLGISQPISTAVTNYFRKFRVLPPKALIVSNTRVLNGVRSFETLLKAIIAENDTDFVIVVHGHETGNGLFLKLATRAGAPAGSETTNQMLQILMDIEGRRTDPKTKQPLPSPVDPNERTQLGGLTDAEINRLIDLMKQVRAKKLKLVEFRGCNLGRNLTSVARFRKFLGAQTFGAPKLHSFFGTFQMRASSGVMASHTTSHQGTTITYPMTFASSTANCCIGVNSEKKPENGHLVAPDTTTLDAWIKANFDPAASSGTDPTLPIHGLWEFPPRPANDPNPVDPDPRPLFPLRVATDGPNKGQNEYSRHVVYKP
jgi:hypothetical protein